jgi:formiminotetrahydrofolate cyclodeaminase
MLDLLASDAPVPAGGSVAALVVAMSAGLVAMAARVSGDPGAVAQAQSIRERVSPLAAEDAAAYREALQAMRAPAGETADERDEGIRRSLVHAAEVPLAIAEAAANAAALAVSVADRGSPAVRGDAAAAALLAAAAARAAANLVAINLAAGTENELVARARSVAEDAADSARFVVDL